MKVSDLKVGDRLFVGRYSVTGSLTDAPSIAWLKASRENKFVAECVLDYIPYDAREVNNPDYMKSYCGNSDYDLSNIRQFLNSAEEVWYEPTHGCDAPPSREVTYHVCSYAEHPGFLCGFEQYERSCLTSEIELPTAHDIVGGRRLELFNRKGVRPKATQDMLDYRNPYRFEARSYIDFVTQTAGLNERLDSIGRDGYIHETIPGSPCGIRPKAAFNPNAEVFKAQDGSGYYLVAANVAAPAKEADNYSWDKISDFLGLT